MRAKCKKCDGVHDVVKHRDVYAFCCRGYVYHFKSWGEIKNVATRID